jgi:hypothetical protein
MTPLVHRRCSKAGLQQRGLAEVKSQVGASAHPDRAGDLPSLNDPADELDSPPWGGRTLDVSGVRPADEGV